MQLHAKRSQNLCYFCGNISCIWRLKRFKGSIGRPHTCCQWFYRQMLDAYRDTRSKPSHSMGPFLQTWFNLIPAWMKNYINTLWPRQNGRHIADDTFKRIFMNENVIISINISLKFVPKGLINNITALVQIMAWRRPGDKPLSDPVMVSLLTHICVTRPQWVNHNAWYQITVQPLQFEMDE